VRPDRTTLLHDLRALIVRSTPDFTGPLGEDAPLISSGVLESTTLVSVALWVEDKIGREMDLSAFDLATEWDSLGAIVDFVERHAPSTGRPAPRSARDRV
jgi:hypothetical protein